MRMLFEYAMGGGKELRCGVGSGAPWCLCGVRHQYVAKSACVRAAQSCLECRSSRIHHGSVGSVCTHTTVPRAANPTTSPKETIQSPLGTAFRSEPRWRGRRTAFASPRAGARTFSSLFLLSHPSSVGHPNGAEVCCSRPGEAHGRSRRAIAHERVPYRDRRYLPYDASICAQMVV
jgi:hypothetical protein